MRTLKWSAARLTSEVVVLALFASLPAGAAALFNFGPEYRADESPRRATSPRVATLRDGRSMVVWTESPRVWRPGDSVIRGQMLDPEGSPTTNVLTLVPHSGGNRSVQALVAQEDGTFVLVYSCEESAPGERSYDHLFAARFDAQGRMVGRERRVSSRGPYDRVYASADSTPDGGLVVAWVVEASNGPPSFGRHFNAAVRRFDSHLDAATGEVILREGTAWDDVYVDGVAVETDGTVVVAINEAGDGAYASLLHRSADLRTELNGHGTYFDDSPGDEALTSLVRLADDSFLVTWTASEAVVVARRFTHDLVPLGPVVGVGKDTGDVQWYPTACARPDGGLVFAWLDQSGRDGDRSGVYGRSFSPALTPTSNDQRLSVDGRGAARTVQLACDAQGGVLAVWDVDRAPSSHVFHRSFLVP